MDNVGLRLKQLRIRQGLSQRRLARNSGVSNATISLIEHGRTRDITKVRADIAIQVTRQGVATLADVARALNRSESAISQLIRSRSIFLRITT